MLALTGYGLFKACRGTWACSWAWSPEKLIPSSPPLATSVLWALHLSYHSLPRPRMLKGGCGPCGSLKAFFPHSSSPHSQGGIKGQETVGQLFPDVDQGPSPF